MLNWIGIDEPRPPVVKRGFVKAGNRLGYGDPFSPVSVQEELVPRPVPLKFVPKGLTSHWNLALVLP